MSMNITEHSVQGVVFRTADRFHAVGGVVHGFSTRLGGVSQGHLASLNLGVARGDDPDRVRENYRRWLDAMGMEHRLVLSRQVHGSVIRAVTAEDAVSDPYAPTEWEADGLMTRDRGVALVIFTADCLPVLLYDPVQRAVCAVHAGWRGTVAGIVPRAVEQMGLHYGSRPEDILAAIGPGISQCHFETGRDVPEGLGRVLSARESAACIAEHGGGKFRADLKKANRLLLEKAGVRSVNITIDLDCTACHLDKYWSHRLIGAQRGSMASAIQLT